MWHIADRVVKSFADMTIGTVIVLVHTALADRASRLGGVRTLVRPGHVMTAQGT